MMRIPPLKVIAQYSFLLLYFAALCGVVSLNSGAAPPAPEAFRAHPLEFRLKELAEPPHEPWSESFIVDYREIYPLRAEGRGKGVEKFVYRIPAGEAPVQMLLVVDLESRARKVVPLKVNAPFGFAEEFVQQKAFFEAFEGRKVDEILPADEGGKIPTVTGAAILSRQVIYAVREGVEFYLAHRGEFGKIIRAEEETDPDPAVEVVKSPAPAPAEASTPAEDGEKPESVSPPGEAEAEGEDDAARGA